MKKIFLYISILILIPINYSNAAPGKWERILDAPTFDVAVNPKNLNTIFAGGEGRVVYRSYDKGAHWDTLIVGYRGTPARLNNVIINPEDTNIVLIGGLLFGDIRRTTDQGKYDSSWKVVLQLNRPIALNGKAMMFKPGDPNVVYASDFEGAVLFRSTDAGAHWDSISKVWKLKKIKQPDGSFKDSLHPVQIASSSIRTDSTNILLVGSTAGDVFISTDSGYTWKYADSCVTQRPVLNTGDCEVVRIVFSNRDPRTGYIIITYITEGNNPNGGLYKTTDGGYNWDFVAFADTSMWAVSCRKYGNDDEVFIGGYTEAYASLYAIAGVGIVRRSLDGGKTWYSYDDNIDWLIEKPLENRNFTAIHFPDYDNGFVVGDNGASVFCQDAGSAFMYFIPELSFSANSVHFFDSDTGFVCGVDGKIQKSTDRGKSWIGQSSGIKRNLNCIRLIDSLSVFACGENGTLISTTNGGKIWTTSNSQTNYNLQSIAVSPNKEIYICGEGGTILKSTDRGASWKTLTTSTTTALKSIYFFNNSSGYACGENGTIIKTNNAGADWINLSSGVPLDLHGICFPDSLIGYAVGDSLTVIKTTNGGSSWALVTVQTNTDLKAVQFVNSERGFAIGDKLTIIRTTNGGVEWEMMYRGGGGSRPNVWSLRYTGNPEIGETLYMTTEAGLFVLDKPSDVEERNSSISENGLLEAYFVHGAYLKLSYKKLLPLDEYPLIFRMVDLLGNIVFETKIFDNERLVSKPLFVQDLPPGFYICQMLEGPNSSTLKIIKDK
ncbi:MAG: C-terminal target protein [Ignavibacteria bacterium]|nr:C-terminal target protein [Ignavibacteria bacterium]